MKYPLILSLSVALSSTVAMGQSAAQPRLPQASACCLQPIMTPSFTGGNSQGLKPDQSASTADIAVVVKQTSVERTAGGEWVFSVAVANDNGNNCTPKDNTRAILQLPPDCQVVHVEALQADGAAASWTQCGAYLDVHLGQLCPADRMIGKPATIKVQLKVSPYTSAACIPAFGVFAFSGMPDHVPGNNNWWWREHCTQGMTFYPKEQPLPSKGQ